MQKVFRPKKKNKVLFVSLAGMFCKKYLGPRKKNKVLFVEGVGLQRKSHNNSTLNDCIWRHVCHVKEIGLVSAPNKPIPPSDQTHHMASHHHIFLGWNRGKVWKCWKSGLWGWGLEVWKSGSPGSLVSKGARPVSPLFQNSNFLGDG